jgi:flagellin
MGLDIVTNSMATNASANLSVNEDNMQNVMAQLSSGYRINKAADDASGLVISQHLQAQIGGFQQAQANTQSAINVVQTADGALNEVSVILQRIRTLSVEAANTSATDSTAQQAAQDEVNQALDSVTNIAQTTVYGSATLLNTTFGTATTILFTFQVGYDGSSASQVNFSVSALSVSNLGLSNFSVTSNLAIASVDAAIQDVSSIRGTLGAYQNELQHISDNETVMVQNLQASNGQIADTNMAQAMVQFTQDQILVSAGVSMLAQANQVPQMVLKLLG